MADHHSYTEHLVLYVAIFLRCTQVTLLVQAQNTNFSYLPFTTQTNFETVQDAQYYANQSSFLMNAVGAATLSSTCGRLLFNQTVKMKDSPFGAVGSFSTAFTFQIIGANHYYEPGFGYEHADGFAFTFTRTIAILPRHTSGGSLCLLPENDNGSPTNRVFAVEFDTYANLEYNDSSDSHIGVNVNSMNSTWSYDMCGGRSKNCSYLCNGGYFTAWIDYDSASQNLEVYFGKGALDKKTPKPPLPLIKAVLDLADLLDEYMYVGFSSSTGLVSEVHQLSSWKFSTSGIANAPTDITSSSSGGLGKAGIIVSVTAGVVLLLLIVGFFVARHGGWRRSSMKRDGKFNLVGRNLVPRLFTHTELSIATRNFSRSELLGSGGFGAVYKGTLSSGTVVAVKWMRRESKHSEESFQAEAVSLSQIRHRNLVQLRGWCREEKLLLVCDYMCNGSLDEWLYQRKEGLEALLLTLRHSVLAGVATALSYLHEECAQCVLHRDIKSSNVLLDGDMNAHLGDFGLARLIDHQKMEKTTMMAGTFGYIAPEMPHTGKATKETDVYSFGVLMLEVMCGARPLDATATERGDCILVDRVWRAHEVGNLLQATDSRLGTFTPSAANSSSSGGSGESSNLITSNPSMIQASAMEDRKRIVNLLQLGLLCCNPNPEDRPSMRLVSQLLQNSESEEIPMPPLAACKPHAHYSQPGFSQFLIRRAPPSSVVSVQDADLGSVQYSTRPSSALIVRDHSTLPPARAGMLASFAAPDSSVLSGR